MNLPWKFPDPQELARQRAEEFQRLTPDNRIREIMDTIETGMLLLRESPNRQRIDELFLQREANWQRLQKELFRKHGG
ncbi:MAG: hypothetical protein L0215_15300 [Gemmataceae bacterium]|nr:hypothetical protein [Gemmataceae bacterium]